MIKARASGSKVYLNFMKKGQAGETPHSVEFLFRLIHSMIVFAESFFESSTSLSDILHIKVGSSLVSPF